MLARKKPDHKLRSKQKLGIETWKQKDKLRRKALKQIPAAEACIYWYTRHFNHAYTWLSQTWDNFIFFVSLTSRSGRLPDLSVKSTPNVLAGIYMRIDTSIWGMHVKWTLIWGQLLKPKYLDNWHWYGPNTTGETCQIRDSNCVLVTYRLILTCVKQL